MFGDPGLRYGYGVGSTAAAGEVFVGDSHDEDSDEGEGGSQDLVLLDFDAEEADGEEECCNDGATSHHLVDGAGDEVEGDVLKGGGDEVTESGDGEEELVHFDFLALGLGLEHAHLVGLGVSLGHDEEDDEGEELTEEHGGGLHVGVEEVFVGGPLVDELRILELVG